ncbi:hypothetical protein AVEN_21843-1 [Araneus ventricosus]|uniref:Uncharacterized protein n=1 Tax=Araneus ventricosus TaxID=182803 RepID=A0A4Y2R522_ARAVE|nr:hypothetical protein AVEN_21843-1 [Araneus ventricosus]
MVLLVALREREGSFCYTEKGVLRIKKEKGMWSEGLKNAVALVHKESQSQKNRAPMMPMPMPPYGGYAAGSSPYASYGVGGYGGGLGSSLYGGYPGLASSYGGGMPAGYGGYGGYPGY